MGHGGRGHVFTFDYGLIFISTAYYDLARSDDERHISMSLKRLFQKYKIYKKIFCWQEIVFDGGGV